MSNKVQDINELFKSTDEFKQKRKKKKFLLANDQHHFPEKHETKAPYSETYS
jgi:hypothetical protein